MMIRRAVLFALTLVTLTTFAATPAHAQEYDGTTAEGSMQPNGDVVVTASGFKPNTTISYTVDKDGVRVASGSAESDSNGDVTFTVEHQGDGEYVLTMTDGQNVQVVGVTVDRTADRLSTGAPDAGPADAGPADTGSTEAGSTEAGPLARTGSDVSVPLSQVGVALVMTGAVAVYLGKRRRVQTIG